MILNISKVERQIRMVLGTALILLGGIELSFLAAILGFAILFTGLHGHCPIYRLLKIDTSNK